MNIDLTFQDLVRLATDKKLERDGATITYGRPVLAEITVDLTSDPPKSGKVVFYLDETDERARR